MRRSTRIILVLLCVAAIVGPIIAGAVLFDRHRRSFLTDDRTIREPAADAHVRSMLWQPPASVAFDDPSENTETESHAVPIDIYEPAVTHDGQTLFFVRNRPGDNADIFTAQRTDAGWSTPEPLVAVNSLFDDLGPSLSPDGRDLYFYSNRPGGYGGYDLWKSSRLDDDTWSDAENLGPAINTAFNEYGCAISPDSTCIVFASNRPRPGEQHPTETTTWPATVRESLPRAPYDLYLAAVTPEGFAAPGLLDALNSAASDGSPAFSPLGDFLYFASNRSGGHGGFDLYRARHLNHTFKHVENLGPAINTLFNELDPAPHLQGFSLQFSSDRLAASARHAADEHAKSLPTYRLFITHSREVYRDIEPRKRIDFAALQAWLLPLAWLLLLLALLLLLLRFLKSNEFKRLSLIVKCLLISLLVHMLLAMLFMAWSVTTGLAETWRRGSSIEVNLIASASTTGIAAQLNNLHAPIESSSPPLIALTAIQVSIPIERQSPPQTNDQPAASIPPPPISAPNLELTPHKTSVSLPPLAATLPLDIATPAEALPALTLPTPHEAPAPSVTEVALHASSQPVTTPLDRAEIATRVETTTAPLPPSLDQATTVITVPPPSAPPMPSPADAPKVASPTPSIHSPTSPIEVAPPDSPLPTATVRLPRETPTPRSPEPSTPTTISPITPPNLALPVLRAATPSIRIDHVDPPIPTTPSIPATPPIPAPDTALPQPAANPAPARVPSPSPQAVATLTPDLDLPMLHPSRLKVPSETELPPPLPDPYIQRAPATRLEIAQQHGGSKATEAAVERALAWLARHQSADGRWSSRHFDEEAHRAGTCAGDCRGPAAYDVDSATTGLALLCFLGAGHTHTIDNPYRAHVQRALDWLINNQKPDGDLRRNRETLYSHGIAAIALGEAFGMTNDPALREPLQQAVTFIVSARSSLDGGWRYDPDQPGDTSVLGWQVMALTSARRAGLAVPAEAFTSASRFLDRVAHRTHPGLYAYQPNTPPSPPMTSEGLFCRQLLGTPPHEPRMAESTALILQNLPDRRRDFNTYYWYYATLALFQQQGDAWQTWNTALTAELLESQRTIGHAAGSWDPADRWSRIGGRIYQTALCTLCLEVYYRYLPMYQ